MNADIVTERRDLLRAAAALGSISTLSGLTAAAAGADDVKSGTRPSPDQVHMTDIPLGEDAKITVERRGAIVLIGINRPDIHNRIDPEAFVGLAKAYYDYDHCLRPGLFGPPPYERFDHDPDRAGALSSAGTWETC